jgi:PAS domain S-box-containing protein
MALMERADGLEQNGTFDVPELQETLLGQALEYGPVGVIVLDERGSFLAANRRAGELCGYSRAELLELGASGVCAEPGLEERLAAMASGALTRGSERIRCKNGSVRDFAFRTGATTVSGLPFFVVMFWDGDGDGAG